MKAEFNEDYESYDAAYYQAKAIVKNLRKTYDMETIRQAFDNVLYEDGVSKFDRSLHEDVGEYFTCDCGTVVSSDMEECPYCGREINSYDDDIYDI